jgi:excisionase family DNA binding protein
MTAPAVSLYTVAEAAQLLGMGRSTLYRAVKAKQVPHRLMPGTDIVRFTDTDIEQIVADAYRPAA